MPGHMNSIWGVKRVKQRRTNSAQLQTNTQINKSHVIG